MKNNSKLTNDAFLAHADTKKRSPKSFDLEDPK